MHVWDNKSASIIAMHGYTCYTYAKVCIKSKQTTIVFKTKILNLKGVGIDHCYKK